ncbi:MAG: MFS transporter [Bacteroidales bacterium]|nr:MFS transporter [Bacteroidales bacterium]
MNQNSSFRQTMPVLLALSACHLFNDLMQSVVSASYPLIKDDMALSYAQIGLISLVYQLAASVFQPVVGYVFDRHPVSRSLNIASVFTLVGLALVALADSIWAMTVAVFLVGLGSAVIHPEASRITSLASAGHRGMAQSLFQVGGNVGGSVGPLLVAAIVATRGRAHIAWFCLVAVIAIIVSRPACRWYSTFLRSMRHENRRMTPPRPRPLSLPMTLFALAVITILIFSKYIYMASLSNYYTFYAIEHFGVSIAFSQVMLFVFLLSTAVGTLVGGPVGDKIGRKYVIWISILGTAPFSLLMPHAGLYGTIALSFGAGFMLSSAFPAILLYAQELLPNKLGLVSGLFYGFAFGVAGVASAILGQYVDLYGLDAVYAFCAYTPLAGIVAAFLPNLHTVRYA